MRKTVENDHRTPSQTQRRIGANQEMGATVRNGQEVREAAAIMDKETLPGEYLFYDSSIGRYCLDQAAKALAGEVDKEITLKFYRGRFGADKPCDGIPE